MYAMYDRVFNVAFGRTGFDAYLLTVELYSGFRIRKHIKSIPHDYFLRGAYLRNEAVSHVKCMGERSETGPEKAAIQNTD